MSKENFLKVYASLPISIRRDIVLVLDSGPITWEVAYLEVINNTEIAEIILEKLSEMKVI